MKSSYELEGVTWVDVESPTAEEISELNEQFKLGPLLADELMRPSQKPHVDLYPDFAYAVLHFPALRQTRGNSVSQEVDIIIGKGFIISVYYEPVAALLDFSRSFEATTLMKRVTGKLHSGHVLFEIIERLYAGVENELEAIEDSIVAIERTLFQGREREMLSAISEVSRELLVHKRTLGTHREILDSFEQAGTSLFGENFRNYFRGMTALHFRVYNKALGFIDTLTELRNTNDSLLSARQNEIVKNLTLVASLLLPLTLISQLFSMNTRFTPLLGYPGDFWVVTGLMAAVGLVLFAYFKIRKWF